MAQDPLTALLMEQALASRTTTPLSAPLQQQSHSTLDAPQRAGIDKALALLTAQERLHMPNVELGRTSPFSWPPNRVEGYTESPDSNIYVPPDSQVYKDAAGGKMAALIKLASVLEHERTHLRSGPDEATAYAAQLALLKRLGPSQDVLDGVALARDSQRGIGTTR